MCHLPSFSCFWISTQTFKPIDVWSSFKLPTYHWLFGVGSMSFRMVVWKMIMCWGRIVIFSRDEMFTLVATRLLDLIKCDVENLIVGQVSPKQIQYKRASSCTADMPLCWGGNVQFHEVATFESFGAACMTPPPPKMSLNHWKIIRYPSEWPKPIPNHYDLCRGSGD